MHVCADSSLMEDPSTVLTAVIDLLELVLEEISPLIEEYFKGPYVKQKTALLNSAISFLTAPVTGGGGGGASGGASGGGGGGGTGDAADGRRRVEELRRLTGHIMR